MDYMEAIAIVLSLIYLGYCIKIAYWIVKDTNERYK